jgi:predicted transcriptional regulator
MNPSRAPQPRHVRYGVRYQARLDAETSAKLGELARIFQRTRAAVLRSVMQWGLSRSRGWTVDSSLPASRHVIHLLLDTDLIGHVQAAAATHRATVAAWVRHAMREVTRDDFPASWRAGETASRSHESGYYHRKFGLRLDDESSQKLEALARAFHRSAAEVIRQLVAQANPENFPESWRVAANEHRTRQPRSANTGSRGRGHS